MITFNQLNGLVEVEVWDPERHAPTGGLPDRDDAELRGMIERLGRFGGLPQVELKEYIFRPYKCDESDCTCHKAEADYGCVFARPPWEAASP